MKILRSEHRRRVRNDLDYALGLLQDIRKVVYKGYKTSMITLDIDAAMHCLTSARLHLPDTKLKIEYKNPWKQRKVKF